MFGTHKLNEQGFQEMKKFKNIMAKAANEANELMTGTSQESGRAKAIFYTNLETAVFQGAKAIASKPENHSEVIEYPLD